MGKVISSLFGGGAEPQGPSKAELAIQKEARDKAVEDRAEAERLTALASKQTSRRKSLAYVDSSQSSTLGG